MILIRHIPPTYVLQQEQNRSSIALRPRKTKTENVSLLCLFTKLSDSQTVQDVVTSPGARKWKDAMDEEYNSLIRNKTWSLVIFL